MTDKNFDPRAIASITTGVLLIEDFPQVHAAIEHIAGYPVWTHELPRVSREVCVPAILAIYPDMPLEMPDDWKVCADGLLERYGVSIQMPEGSAARTEDPISTLMDIMKSGAAA